MMNRPRTTLGSMTTTPRSSSLIALLGRCASTGPVTISSDEYRHLQRMYGLTTEPAPTPPPPPEAPQRFAFQADWQFRDAMAQHEAATREHAAQTTPAALESLRAWRQSGADRDMFRHADADGLRVIAWLARYVPLGEDPLKTVVQLAAAAGFDVDAEDVEWALHEGNETPEEREDSPKEGAE